MKFELVEDWRKAWRWASVQLAAFAGILTTALLAGWPVVQWSINELLPNGPGRIVVAVIGGLLTIVIPVASRLVKKIPKDC